MKRSLLPQRWCRACLDRTLDEVAWAFDLPVTKQIAKLPACLVDVLAVDRRDRQCLVDVSYVASSRVIRPTQVGLEPRQSISTPGSRQLSQSTCSRQISQDANQMNLGRVQAF